MPHILKIFEQMKLSPKELLKPDDFLEFHEDIHRYYDLKKKHWVPTTISALAKDSSYFSRLLGSDDQSAKKQQLLESIDRGNEVHKGVEHFYKTGEKINIGKWQPWLDSFLNYPNLKGWDCVASEYRLCDRRYDIAGTLDLLLQYGDVLALCDIKTKNPGFNKNHMEVKTQLGGYVSLLYRNWPSLDIKTCRVYWVTNEACTSDEYSTIDCLDLYERARQLYRQKLLPLT